MRTFFTVWAGQVVSLLGSGLTNFGLGIWVFQKTGSATLFTTIAFLAMVPGIIAAPFAGVMVDRWDRRLTMLFSDLLSAIVVAVVALVTVLGHLEVWVVMVLAALTSFLAAFQVPAAQASVSMMVPKQQLVRAAGLVQAGQAVADLAAPLLGGFLFAKIGVQGLVALDFASFFFGIGTLAIVRFPALQRTTKPSNQQKPSMKQEFVEGWRFIRDRAGLLYLLSYFAVLNFLLPMAGVLYAPMLLSFASPTEYGTAMAVMGCGMLVGSIVMGAWGGPKKRSVGVMVSGLLIGVFLAGSGLRANVPLMSTFGFLMMFMSPIINGCSQAIWQSKTPLDLQGRVFSVRRMIAQGTAPIAMLIAGPLVDHVFGPAMMPGGSLAPLFSQILGVGPGRGTGLIFLLMGSLTVLGSLLTLASPAMRNIEDGIPDASTAVPA